MMSANKIKQDAPMSVLFTMLFAGQIASTIFLPGLPSIAAELNIPRSIVQTMVPVYLAAFASPQTSPCNCHPISFNIAINPRVSAAAFRDA